MKMECEERSQNKKDVCWITEKLEAYFHLDLDIHSVFLCTFEWDFYVLTIVQHNDYSNNKFKFILLRNGWCRSEFHHRIFIIFINTIAQPTRDSWEHINVSVWQQSMEFCNK